MNDPTHSRNVAALAETLAASAPAFDVLRYEKPTEGDDGIQTLSYEDTIHAAADAIEKGANPAALAKWMLDQMDEEDSAALDDTCRGLGSLFPQYPLGRLCLALNAEDGRHATFLPLGGWETQGVVDLMASLAAANSMLKSMVDPVGWVCSLNGTEHPTGLAELREEVAKLRALLPAARNLVKGV